MPGDELCGNALLTGAGLNAYDLIAKKRDGCELTTGEIRWLVSEFTAERLPDYQMAAWLMAVCIRGMSDRETADLTLAMADSGEKLDLSAISGVKVDKHSTGGVGDKTTLVLVPLLAAADLKLAKMSGRGLGHTGGTIDKLEAIPGFRTALTPDEIAQQVKQIGAAIAAQTEALVPADKKMYALRDVTATVESIPLIAASVMSKKLAAGADIIVLDVKYGSGAFMRTRDDAERLAETMIGIGKRAGRKVVAAITSMNDVLGRAVGNSLEVAEAVETLKGGGPPDLRDLCLFLGGAALQAADPETDRQAAEVRLGTLLDNGAAARKLVEIIAAQGGDPRVVDDPSILGMANSTEFVVSKTAGYVSAVDVRKIGWAAVTLGAGRVCKEGSIDPHAGLIVYKKLSDKVEQGDVLAALFADRAQEYVYAAAEGVRAAYLISDSPPAGGGSTERKLLT